LIINNGKLAQSMRMSLPAALVRSLGLMKGMTAYIKVEADWSSEPRRISGPSKSC